MLKVVEQMHDTLQDGLVAHAQAHGPVDANVVMSIGLCMARDLIEMVFPDPVKQEQAMRLAADFFMDRAGGSQAVN